MTDVSRQWASEGCETTTDWTGAELRLLNPLPPDVLETPVWCELEVDHEAPHWALGQAGGSHEDEHIDHWWLRCRRPARRRRGPPTTGRA